MIKTITAIARPLALALGSAAIFSACTAPGVGSDSGESNARYELTDKVYFARPGANVLPFSNPPGGLFFDSKTSGVEIIHHGERTATNGDVRLQATPEQWDGMGQLVERRVEADEHRVVTELAYPEHDFQYQVITTTENGKVRISVQLDEPLPGHLEGEAGLNMEFLPAAYFGKGYLADGAPGTFPRHPAGPMRVNEEGRTVSTPIAQGRELVLAPEDPERRISIRNRHDDRELMLFDGRNKAQNGWYVVRSMLPAGQTGTVAEWELDIHGISGWTRDPVISYSQLGYHPAQPKQAVVELDSNAPGVDSMRLVKVTENGQTAVVLEKDPEQWGEYLRYRYLTFDFSDVREPGLYQLEYGDQTSGVFRISEEARSDTWQLTLDVFFPVQMDHMTVREAYRVWHGASHLDDALQAPPNYEHFDLFAHGDTTDTAFEPFEHIPGLNYGGWYDAGDYDIRTQSQYFTVQHLVHVWEQFGVDRDTTTVSQAKKYTQIHRPDGKPDLLQQIEHGTLGLIAQHRAVGHAIPGIVAGHLYQYPHLGDGSTKTDNKVYDPSLDPLSDERSVGEMYEPSTVDPTPEEPVVKEEGNRSGRFDDRWAFTSNTTALNYGSAAALAAASRALQGYNDELAQESLATAERVWEYEAGREPNTFRVGNTTGRGLNEEHLKAAVELLLATEKDRYAQAVGELLPKVRDDFAGHAFMLVLALPYMDDAYRQELEQLTRDYRASIAQVEADNPFGVPITRGGWAGAGTVVGFGVTNYWLNQAFPEIVEEELVHRSLNFIYGLHPDSSYSFVSGLGPASQTIAYGNNRADFSFIPGGIVPGILVLPPDYPENKSNWPFFWGQNEYVITVGGSYLFLAKAAESLLAR
ncbi:glycoside hydrolase family 9 protein [Marinimicrobium agarilyticum]|uniref:glycoside hydrolase family 9 protein n=1 Tax=Marinimicrobium agarilyticum TaxID=306546 RepID=UPI00041D58A4|nr:glycoside hydrolase family 9 protein [Marinimicrobium agarilyticum]